MSEGFGAGLLSRLPEPPRKVALVRASRIGDFVCATPAFRALRSALPGAEITLVALPWARELAARSRHLDRFEPFPGFPGIAEQFFDGRRTAGFLRRMQADRFDLVLQLHGSGAFANPFALMLRARATAGFVRDLDGVDGLEAALPLPRGVHEVRRLLALSSFLGAPARGEETEFPLAREDEREAEELLGAAEPPLVGVHPAATDPTKRWAPERFAAAATELAARGREVTGVGLTRGGGTVVLLGGPAERPLAEAVQRALAVPALNLAGRTSLPVLGAVVARLSVLVTNDSGPAHVAYAVGTRSVTVFGATDPAFWGPLSGPHAVVAKPCECRAGEEVECRFGYPCLRAVTPEEVAEAADVAMKGGI